MSEPRVSFDGDGVMGAGGGRGGELGQRKARAVNSAVGFGVRGEGGESSGSPVTEACLLVALDLTEGAVLENRSGEAAAGLLRALRTGRGGWGSSGMWGGLRGRGGGSALAGGGRGQVEGGVMSALVEKLEEVRRGECRWRRASVSGGRSFFFLCVMNMFSSAEARYSTANSKDDSCYLPQQSLVIGNVVVIQ